MGCHGFLMSVVLKVFRLMEKGTLRMDDNEETEFQYAFDFDEEEIEEIPVDFSLVKDCWDIYDELSVMRMDYESY